jgi:hypothetical protein
MRRRRARVAGFKARFHGYFELDGVPMEGDMIKIIPIALLLVCGSSVVLGGEGSGCSISPAEHDTLMELSFDGFDQTMGEGWRKYSKQGCKKEAASLLDEYFEVHRANLEGWQERINRWHAGQVYALMDDYETARERFLASYDPDEAEDPEFPWNDYVDATIAFLDGDREKLQKHRDRIAATEGQQNLQVVDNLLEFLGKPYSVAYSGGPAPKKD